jgi:putative sugar O-methyltransferase
MNSFVQNLKKTKVKLNDFVNYKNFKKFWKNLDKFKIIDQDLIFFIDNYVHSESYNYTSRYWSTRNVKHLNLLIDSQKKNELNYEISSDYFTWLDITNSRVQTLVKELDNEEFDEKFTLAKQQKFLTPYESIQHNILLIMLYKFLAKIDNKNYLNMLREKNSFIKNNPFIEINNFKISQDLVNSIIELYEIEQSLNIFKHDKKISILEIGAGNGRTADTITNVYKSTNYVICDIPMASYISFKRFKDNYPEKKVSCLFDFNSEDKLINQIKKNDISFILPHQLSLIKEKYFDVVIALDCIHEMDKKTIKFYMNNINNLAKFFFMKVWETTDVPYELNHKLNIHNNSYQFFSKWELIKKKQSIFPSNFYNIAFKIN